MVEQEAENTDPKATFRLIVIQTELERFKYLVRSFLRARLAKVLMPTSQSRPPSRLSVYSREEINTSKSLWTLKYSQIDTHALHCLTDPSTKSYLSPAEIQYATAHTSILHAHYASSFLSQFPASLQRMDDTAGGISMVEVPDVDTAVFVRGLRDVEEPVGVPGTEIDFEMRRGDVLVTRWSAVRGLVLAGDAELI